jgi:hypothetical protein
MQHADTRILPGWQRQHFLVDMRCVTPQNSQNAPKKQKTKTKKQKPKTKNQKPKTKKRLESHLSSITMFGESGHEPPESYVKSYTNPNTPPVRPLATSSAVHIANMPDDMAVFVYLLT